MAVIKPFRALRPKPELARLVAAAPYDVLNSEEARAKASGNDLCYHWINKAEINFPPGMNPYSPEVYLKARERLDLLVSRGALVREATPRVYLYEQRMGDHVQAGLVASASVDEYDSDRIKKHEHTKPDKVADRTRVIDTLDAQGGPVFLAYRARADLTALQERVRAATAPLYDFVADDEVHHRVWILDDTEQALAQQLLLEVPTLYVADGHHRSASTSRVRAQRKQANPGHRGDEPYNYFLAVIFPHDQLRIMDYNRVVRDLRGQTEAQCLARIGEKFLVEPAADPAPPAMHTCGMFLGGRWYRLTAKPGTYPEADPVGGLDVAILQSNVLTPILGIDDPRTDPRIDFVGGIRGLGDLERRCREGWAVAFAMYPTTLDQLFSVADAGLVMPPKSTWFEPKLRSGLLIRKLDG